MKKITLALFLFASLSLSAQKLSVDFAGGYSLGLARLSSTSEIDSYSGGVYTGTTSVLPISFSSGWIGRLGLTAQLNDQMFVSFAARYRNSGEKEYNFYVGTDTDGADTYEATESIFIKHNNVELQLGFGLKRKIGSRLSLALSAGPSIGVLGTTQYRFYEKEKTVFSGFTTEEQYDEIIELIPHLQIGGYTDVALSYSLSEKISLFGNATLRIQTWSPKTAKVTSVKENGVEMVNQLTTYQAETEYLSSVDNLQSQPDQSQPSKETRSWFPASSVEIAIGVRYSLGAAPKASVPSSEKRGIYISALGGYGFGLGGETNYSSDQNTQSSEMFSHGGGMHFGLLGGFSFGSGISVELGGAFNQSTTEYNFGFSNPTEIKDVATMIRSQVGIKIEGDGNRINPFLRAGLATGIASKIVSTSKSPNSERESEFTGGLSFGGYGGIGVSVNVSSAISVIAQGTVFMQNWAPNNYKRTKSTISGIDQLANATVYDLETEFSNELTVSSNDPNPNQNDPRQSVTIKFPFSAACFSLGVRYTFGK